MNRLLLHTHVLTSTFSNSDVGDNSDVVKMHWRLLKFFSRTTILISTNLIGTKHSNLGGKISVLFKSSVVHFFKSSHFLGYYYAFWSYGSKKCIIYIFGNNFFFEMPFRWVILKFWARFFKRWLNLSHWLSYNYVLNPYQVFSLCNGKTALIKSNWTMHFFRS